VIVGVSVWVGIGVTVAVGSGVSEGSKTVAVWVGASEGARVVDLLSSVAEGVGGKDVTDTELQLTDSNIIAKTNSENRTIMGAIIPACGKLTPDLIIANPGDEAICSQKRKIA
jgi:hypothetical protein